MVKEDEPKKGKIMSEALDKIKAIMEEERQKGYNQGIMEGICAAMTIALWYQENPKLIEPRSPDILKEWTEKKIDELKGKME